MSNPFSASSHQRTIPPAAKAAAPLAHWSKTSLSSTSCIPYDNEGNEKSRQYNSRIDFDIRFKDFIALGSFGTKVSSLAHVEVQNIEWTLAPNTLKSFQSQLRKEAAKDAIDKARDYCEAFGCQNLRPVELDEGDISGLSRSGLRNQRLCGPQYVMARQSARSTRSMGGEDERTEDLQFDPQEIKINMDVTVKFHADHA